MPAMLELLDQRGDFGRRVMQVDYEQYAAGEADLGWLNGSFLLHGKRPFDLDRCLLRIVDALRQSLAAAGSETAHLKVIGLWEGAHSVVNLIAGDAPADLSLAAARHVPRAHVIVNARVAADPQALRQQVNAALESACQEFELEIFDQYQQSFRPGLPAAPQYPT